MNWGTLASLDAMSCAEPRLRENLALFFASLGAATV
jgi:hypothetical protein